MRGNSPEKRDHVHFGVTAHFDEKSDENAAA